MVTRSHIPRRLLRTLEAAEYMAMSTNQVRTLVHNGELAFIQAHEGGVMLFDLRDLDNFIERSKRRMTDTGDVVSVRAQQEDTAQVVEIPRRGPRGRAKALQDRQYKPIDSVV